MTKIRVTLKPEGERSMTFSVEAGIISRENLKQAMKDWFKAGPQSDEMIDG